MQALDHAALVRYHIPRLLLMEQAGFALAQAARALQSHPAARVVVCCGLGFNGGDGLAAARHLAGEGVPVRVILTGARHQLREEPLIFARTLAPLGVEVLEVSQLPLPALAAGWIDASDVLIDALLGLGGRAPVREPLASLIGLMNQSGKPIIAADVPSGLDADTGEVQGVAVRAQTTVTFGRAKQGCLQGEGPRHTGRLLIAPIGFPKQLLEEGLDA
jgi:NAD(P)H-hydrate epimerase